MEHTQYDKLLERAKAGDAEAKYQVGTAILSEKAVFTDNIKHCHFNYAPDYGLELIKEAADLKHPDAMAQLGLLYISGGGVPQDQRKGLVLTNEAAKAGSLMAQNNLGWWLYTGELGHKDLNAAFTWTKKASDAGFVPAIETLAMMYWNGEGTHPDFKEALKWLIQGANDGNAVMREVVLEIKAAKVTTIQGKIFVKNGRLAWSKAAKQKG